MIETPWGNVDDLRKQKLAPGPGSSGREVGESQRRRLLGAMVASVAEKGYEETAVADLAEMSGVSPRSFYQLFESKQDCFLAAVKGSAALAVERIMSAPSGSDWREEGRNRIDAFVAFVTEQPAAARVLLVEAYATGSEPSAIVDGAIQGLEQALDQRLKEGGLPRSMPREIIIGAIGAAIATARIHLLRGRLQRLPETAGELATFLLGFEPPARPLRVAVRPPAPYDEELQAGDHAERALRAFEALLAERAFAQITMGQVAERAGMSVRTLYANFSGREDLMLAAVDAAAMQAVAVMLPAYRRGSSSPAGVRAAFSALFGMLASRPNLAYLLFAGTREGGVPALERRAEVLRQIEPLLSVGVPAHQRPVSIRIASEALLGAVLEVGTRRLADSGAGALPGLVAICSYMVLAPVLGAEQATAAAEGKSYRKPPPATVDAILGASTRSSDQQLSVALIDGPRTVSELHEMTLLSMEEVDHQVQVLEAAGVIERVGSETGSEEPRYRVSWARIDTEESHGLSRAEREAFSMEIGQVIKAEVEEAVQAGTFDAREDRFLVRLPLWLDEQGWEELLHHLDGSFDTSLGIQRRALTRLHEDGKAEAGSFGRLLLVTFEVPEGDEEHDGS
jgi:TetR/AcrR family transcriptional regulator